MLPHCLLPPLGSDTNMKCCFSPLFSQCCTRANTQLLQELQEASVRWAFGGLPWAVYSSPSPQPSSPPSMMLVAITSFVSNGIISSSGVSYAFIKPHLPSAGNHCFYSEPSRISKTWTSNTVTAFPSICPSLIMPVTRMGVFSSGSFGRYFRGRRTEDEWPSFGNVRLM